MVLNCDETSARSVTPAYTVWKHQDDPTPIIASTQSDKYGITMLATVTASGRKLPLTVFVAGKTDRSCKKFSSIITDAVFIETGVKSGWCNDNAFLRYLIVVILEYSGGLPVVLVFDKFPPHITPFVKESAADLNIHIVEVPAGQTGELQPLDVGVFGPIKQIVKKMWTSEHKHALEGVDSPQSTISRHITAFNAISAQTIRKAWAKANPLLAETIS